MTPTHQCHILSIIAPYLAPRSAETVTDWSCAHVVFNEPNNTGPFNTHAREFIREPLDTFSNDEITDLIMAFGSQAGKTAMIMAGVSYTMITEPSRFLWVMPTGDNSKKFNKTRLTPQLKASPIISPLIPTGAARHNMTSSQMMLGGNIIDLVGSNSPANLASNPCRVVVQDEIDKFDEGGKEEASAINLADQRTKKFPNAKRVKTSTPTLSDGPIWQELLKTDMRRRFVPCPHCGKFVVFAWSKDFTVFKLTGDEAFVRWDKEAKREDGTWDLDRVKSSARFECSHCGGHIQDGQKTQMDRLGQWRPTKQAARGFRGYHLPSLYAASVETSVGNLAVKFLQGIKSLEGLQGFINGDLAEPWENQESRGERVELMSTGPAPADATKLMTIDCQALSPYFWWLIRAWKAGDCVLVDWGHCDTEEELSQIQQDHLIPDHHVGIDSGDMAQTVYEYCLRHGATKRFSEKSGDSIRTYPLFVGWLPMKGVTHRIHWVRKKGETPRPYFLGNAALPTGKVRLKLLEFAPDTIKEIHERLRAGKTRFKYEVNELADEEYFNHQDAEIKKRFYSSKTKRFVDTWVLRKKNWPNHLRDCELMQDVFAIMLGLLPWDEKVKAEEAKQ